MNKAKTQANFEFKKMGWHSILSNKDKTTVMAKKKAKNAGEDLKKKREPQENKNVSEAHDQAEKDIDKDPDLNTKPHREDDLDEGELARLEGED